MKAFQVVLSLAIIAVVTVSGNECPPEQEWDWTIEKLLPHPDCDKFYKCTYGQPVEQKCPPGLLFSLENLRCEWPRLVDCTNRTIPGVTITTRTQNAAIINTKTTPVLSTSTRLPLTKTSPVSSSLSSTTSALTSTTTTPAPITSTTTTSAQTSTSTTSAPTTITRTSSAQTTLAPITSTTTISAQTSTSTTSAPTTVTRTSSAQTTSAPITSTTTTSAQTSTSVPSTTTTTTSVPTDVSLTTRNTSAPITTTTITSPTAASGTTSASTNVSTTTLASSTTSSTSSAPNVTTTQGSGTSLEIGPNGCPVNPSVHWLVRHETDCNSFYYCVWGQKVLRQCSGELHFNQALQVCDSPQNAGCSVALNKHLEARQEIAARR